MVELDYYSRQDEYIFTIKDLKGDKILTKVVLRPNESQQQLFSRFRKKVSRSGNLRAVLKKRWFVSKSEVRRIAKKKAIRKQKRRQRIRHRRGY
jgi:small subunit ribosomal protein S21